MKLNVKYFAWVKSRIGKPGDILEVDADEITVEEMIQHLKALSPDHADAFSNPNTVQYAVNMEYAEVDEVLRDGGEIGCFPPVTGGAA